MKFTRIRKKDITKHLNANNTIYLNKVVKLNNYLTTNLAVEDAKARLLKLDSSVRKFTFYIEEN